MADLCSMLMGRSSLFCDDVAAELPWPILNHLYREAGGRRSDARMARSKLGIAVSCMPAMENCQAPDACTRIASHNGHQDAARLFIARRHLRLQLVRSQERAGTRARHPQRVAGADPQAHHHAL